MQVTFLILVLSFYIQNSSTNPPPQGTAWGRSRYIIDNRRNALFSKKPSTALLQSQEYPVKESPAYRFGQDGFKQRLFPVERYHKDLAAEASISEPKFYRNYGDNSLPGKIVKSYKIPGGFVSLSNGIFENQTNGSEVLDPQNFIQNENDVVNDVESKAATTTEKTLTWVPNEGVLVSASSTSVSSKEPQKASEVRTEQGYNYGIPTTASYPWEIAKTEQGNQIDNGNEKHVYETRIETVSYHQEVIFNPPKKQNWYREEREEPKNYERQEENYEQPEENYEQPEENYEQPEENYEQPEENYEEPEKNYELDEAVNVMSQGRIHAPQTEDNKNKFGYVVEGTNYRKYRVEERTVDGFIVGEYGVVSHDDGSLRGVRYTADGNTNPKLIYEALIKFLSL